MASVLRLHPCIGVITHFKGVISFVIGEDFGLFHYAFDGIQVIYVSY